MKTPDTFFELFDFYYQVVKPLYADISAENQLPQETLFEINAAFDHLSRHWFKDKPQSECKSVEKAYAHLKRSCFDVFKIFFRDTISNYNNLCKIDLSLIDNGTFEKDLYTLIAQIKKKATLARQVEGIDVELAFKHWTDVFQGCNEFKNSFFLNKNVPWAKRKTIKVSLKSFLISIAVAIIASFIAGWLSHICF